MDFLRKLAAIRFIVGLLVALTIAGSAPASAFGIGKLGAGLGRGGALGGASIPVPAVLPFNGLIAFMGDSQTANGITISGATTTYQGGAGFAPHVLTYIGNVLRMPIGGNKGTTGQTTTQMLSRFSSDILGLSPRPSAVVIEGGTNDIGLNSTPAATIVANIQSMCRLANRAGILAVVTTILPRFGTSALTAPQETIRVDTNTLLNALASSDIVVADAAALSWTAADFAADGLHTNNPGADKWGRSIATALLPRLTAGDVLGLLSIGTNWNVNLPLTGSGGTPAGTANSYTVDSSNAGGATVTPSKDVDGKQLITVSGNYTGNSKEFFIAVSQATAPVNGDTFEPIASIQLLADSANISTITMYGIVLSAGFANLGTSVNTITGLLAADGVVPIRGPSIQLAAAGAFTTREIHISFPSVGAVSTAISIQFKLHGVGVHRVN